MSESGQTLLYTESTPPVARAAEQPIMTFKTTCPGRICRKYFRSMLYDAYYGRRTLMPKIELRPESRGMVVTRWEVNKGYHSYLVPCGQFQDVLDDCTYDVGVFVIPKGAKYYLGEYNEIVSDTIIYIGKYEDLRGRLNREDGRKKAMDRVLRKVDGIETERFFPAVLRRLKDGIFTK